MKTEYGLCHKRNKKLIVFGTPSPFGDIYKNIKGERFVKINKEPQLQSNTKFQHICMACGGVGYLEGHYDVGVMTKINIICESCSETLVVWSQGW